MQNFMFTSAVNAGGRVFTASHWDEAHRESGIYENGDVIGNCAAAMSARMTSGRSEEVRPDFRRGGGIFAWTVRHARIALRTGAANIPIPP